jgi:hypothetical protein
MESEKDRHENWPYNRGFQDELCAPVRLTGRIEPSVESSQRAIRRVCDRGGGTGGTRRGRGAMGEVECNEGLPWAPLSPVASLCEIDGLC